MHVPRAILAAQKAPRRIDAVAPPAAVAGAGAAGAGVGGAPSAAASSLSQHGSAWNAAGTYEERDVSPWASAELTARLGSVRIALAPRGGGELGGELGGEVNVSSVTGVEGHASIIANRGKVKRPFEFKLDLAWEMDGGDPATACAGVISYGEISPAPTGAAEAVTIEIQSEWFTKPPGNAAAKDWAASVLAGPFRAKVLAETTAFVEALAIK